MPRTRSRKPVVRLSRVIAILDRLQGGSQKIRECGYDFEAILTNDDLDLPEEAE